MKKKPELEPCPMCHTSDNLALFKYENNVIHLECTRCVYLGPGESTAKKAIAAHNELYAGTRAGVGR